MIRLSGLEPGRDIEITYTGIRPGERLNEILFAREEATVDIGIAGIVGACPVRPSLATIRAWLARFEAGVARHERGAIYAVFREAIPDFDSKAA
jgi:O-antigen biosynthesis protein WbqV